MQLFYVRFFYVRLITDWAVIRQVRGIPAGWAVGLGRAGAVQLWPLDLGVTAVSHLMQGVAVGCDG